MANGATLPQGSYIRNASTTGVVAGARQRDDVQAARQVIQFGRGVLINANVTPMVAASQKVGKPEIIYGYVAYHNEFDSTPGFVTLDDGTGGLGSGSGYDSTDTTLIVSVGQGTRLKQYDVVKYLGTGEEMWVSTDPPGDTITVVRGWTSSANTTYGGANGAAAAAIPANAELQILRPAFPENSQRPKSKSTEPLVVTTILQCSRFAIEASRRSMDGQNYMLNGSPGVEEFERQHRETIDEFQRADERSLLHNQGTTSISSTTKPTTTDGIPSRILTNRFNISGALDEVTLVNYSIATRRYNNGKDGQVIHFIGDNMVRTLQSFARDGMRYTPDVKVLGSSAIGYRVGAHTMNFVEHGMFSPLSSSAAYTAGAPVGWLLSVNFDYVKKLQYGKNGGLRYNPNAKTPGQDGEVGEWTYDNGIKLMNERAHGFMYGISGL